MTRGSSAAKTGRVKNEMPENGPSGARGKPPLRKNTENGPSASQATFTATD
jgi:hypothetical protein